MEVAHVGHGPRLSAAEKTVNRSPDAVKPSGGPRYDGSWRFAATNGPKLDGHCLSLQPDPDAAAVQKGKSLYSGTFDAFCKILKTEGICGLYRGFMVNTFTLISGQAYITTYELVRKHRFPAPDDAGARGAPEPVQAQTQNDAGHVEEEADVRPDAGHNGADIAEDGFRGFYRGYVASLLTYIPNSALWWPFYHCYAEQLSNLAPSSCPHLLLQAIAGPMAAATASTITNPMDVVRARVQVEGRSSVIGTFKQLLAEEGVWGLTKGLSARVISSTPTSVLIVVGYETLKRLSLRADLIDQRHW
ncbi:hypothetical protein WMY93_023747 [Mugilogobius chulae]|uniref:Solute carrier family 25 member 44 n=1 Tax=Mugilogobius chulae TaxID=88201 RepID=A0AAW0NC38_9GOBI